MQTPSNPNLNSNTNAPQAGKEWLVRLEELASEVCRREGCELYDLEFIGAAQGRTLRIFIDKAEGFIGVEDCSNVSKGMNAILDAEDVIPGDAYHLEVSSPGLERDLKRPQHFLKVVGQKIWIKFTKTLENLVKETSPVQVAASAAPVNQLGEDFAFKSAKQLTVDLLAADESGIKIKIETTELLIPWSGIEKAKSVFDFDGPQKNERSPKGGQPNKKGKHQVGNSAKKKKR